MKKYICLILLVCFLSLQDGYLALFTEDSHIPRQTFPYRVSLYPKMDQQALEEGIPIHSQRELEQLLEDYLS